jgi:hypothetical protein
MENIFEGFTEEGTPDLKYYAFDWDDNIMYMPTKIILKNNEGKEVGMGTHDFAKYRTMIGKEEFEYNGHTIVDFSQEPFRNFREQGDKDFIIGSLIGKKGPAWSDFVEAINGGSIFAIITARGHNPMAIKSAIRQLIEGEIGGISKKELLKNLRKYRDQIKGLSTEKINDKQLNMILQYENIVTSYLESLPDKLRKRILLMKYDSITSVEFLLKSFDQYMEEIISDHIRDLSKINVSQYNITYNCITEKGVLKLELTSSVKPCDILYSYLKVKYDKTVEKIRELKKSYDVYKLYISKKTQILNNMSV